MQCMKNLKVIVLTPFLLFIPLTYSAVEYPDYCSVDPLQLLLDKADCSPEQSMTFDKSDEDLDDIITLSDELKQQQFKDNLRRTAVIKLLEEKRNILGVFGDFYSQKDGHKFYHYGLKRKKSANPNGAAKLQHSASCFANDTQLKDKADEMSDGFAKFKKENSTDEKQLDVLASLLLSSIAAEEGLEQRPRLSKKIKDNEKKIKKLQADEEDAKKGIIKNSVGHLISADGCKRIIDVQGYVDNEANCKRYKEMALSAPNKIKEYEDEIATLEQNRDMLDQAIFQNPFLAEPRDIGDSVTESPVNFFKNVFTRRKESEKVYLGKYKKSQMLSKGLEGLRRIPGGGDSFIQGIKRQIKSTESVDGTKPHVFAFLKVKELLKDNKPFRNEFKALFKKELKESIDESDESIKEICKDKKDSTIIQLQQLVDRSKEEYLEAAQSELGKDADLAALASSFEEAHCAALKTEQDGRWFENLTGFKGTTALQLGGGATALGTGLAATLAGCAPCLPVAIIAGGTAAGAGLADTQRFQKEADITRGLANLDLAEQEKARETLRDAQLGWAFVGVDVAMAPLGLSGGKLIKAGKLVQQGRKGLKQSELGKNKYFFKTLVNGLPEDEYLRIVEELQKLPLDEQKRIADALSNLKDKNAAERLNSIEKVLRDSGIKVPDEFMLNSRVLASLEKSPQKINDLKIQFSDDMKKVGIEPGSADEQTFLRIAGILQSKGCAGICRKQIVTNQEVMDEYNRLMKSCSI